jgi:hypothetical protein
MAKLKDLAVVTGSYTNSSGEQKNRYLNIGVMMSGNDGGSYLMLHRHVNLAGLPFKEGSESILVSMFDPKERDGGNSRQSGGNQSSGYQQNKQSDLDDDVPF